MININYLNNCAGLPSSILSIINVVSAFEAGMTGAGVGGQIMCASKSTDLQNVENLHISLRGYLVKFSIQAGAIYSFCVWLWFCIITKICKVYKLQRLRKVMVGPGAKILMTAGEAATSPPSIQGGTIYYDPCTRSGVLLFVYLLWQLLLLLLLYFFQWFLSTVSRTPLHRSKLNLSGM